MAKFDPTRLVTQLQNTGLAVKDNPLFQLIFQMLKAMAAINAEVNGISSSSSSSASVINQVIQQFNLDSGSGSDDDISIPGPAGIDGENGMVPYFIAADEVFIVPEFKQALFSMNIDNEGILEVNGFLIEVDGIPESVVAINQFNFDSSDCCSDDISIPGPQGNPGINGSIGISGLDGLDGEDGLSIPGSAGASGSSGSAGVAGPPGFNGEDGLSEEFYSLINKDTISVTITTTGNIDDLDFGNVNLIRMNNASLATIRGLKAGTDGQRVTIVSIGAGQVNLAHQNTNSAAGNRLINFAISAATPLAAGVGTSAYQYDATTARWRLITHDQGEWIAQTYASGDFTGNGAMTWTVDVGDVLSNNYWLKNRTLFMWVALTATAIGGVPNTALQQTIPGGFSFSALGGQARLIIQVTDGAVQKSGLIFAVTAASTNIQYYTDVSTTTVWVSAPGIFANFALPIT